jgi:hypothetical protein
MEAFKYLLGTNLTCQREPWVFRKMLAPNGSQAFMTADLTGHDLDAEIEQTGSGAAPAASLAQATN